jgi:RNA polymerase primary sigma factor/RNA polymerase sigma factor
VNHVWDDSFAQRAAERLYGDAPPDRDEFTASHMPDDVTREYARRMHYAAYRLNRSATPRARARWQHAYRTYRDRIVMGNRKLVFRAVRRWSAAPSMEDDLIGDCQVVLIQAVAAYNPFLGIRFSTYAFTCLMRALSRLSQRHAADRLARSLPLESLPDGEPRDAAHDDETGVTAARVYEFLREGHHLLTSREKRVIVRRFKLDQQARTGTLEQVGREMGLSKERVRQVQASALGKLRKALLHGAGES